MWEGLRGGILEVPGEDGAVSGSGRLPAAPWRRCSSGPRRAGGGLLAKRKGVEGEGKAGTGGGETLVCEPPEGTDLRGDPADGAPGEWGTSGWWGSGRGG